MDVSQNQSQSYFTTDSQSVSKSWCRAQSGTFDQRYYYFFFSTTHPKLVNINPEEDKNIPVGASNSQTWSNT
jgi:hypothetical protein